MKKKNKKNEMDLEVLKKKKKKKKQICCMLEVDLYQKKTHQ